MDHCINESRLDENDERLSRLEENHISLEKRQDETLDKLESVSKELITKIEDLTNELKNIQLKDLTDLKIESTSQKKDIEKLIDERIDAKQNKSKLFYILFGGFVTFVFTVVGALILAIMI